MCACDYAFCPPLEGTIRENKIILLFPYALSSARPLLCQGAVGSKQRTITVWLCICLRLPERSRNSESLRRV